MTERESLTALCGRLGASPSQAGTMADQLIKRCDQLALARGWPRERAMEHLLTVLIKGRNGETVPGFEGGPPPAADQAAG